MPDASRLEKAFKERLSNLEKESGNQYFISFDGLSEHLAKNKLNPCWFTPGTLISTVKINAESEKEETAVFEIYGSLRADLYDSDGVLVGKFVNSIYEIEDNGNGFHLLNDVDLDMLINGTYPTGHFLKIQSGNSVISTILNKKMRPVEVNSVSVAKAILDRNIIAELLSHAAGTEDISKQGTVSNPKEENADVAKSKREAALQKSLESLGEIGESDFPANKKKSEKEENETEAPKEEPETAIQKDAVEKEPDISEKTDIKKEEKEVEKMAEKKKTKEKKETPKPVNSGRYDLLPLDVVCLLIEPDADQSDYDKLMLIDSFMKTGDEKYLIRAAKAACNEHYEDCESAMLDLAVFLEEDAESNGEGSWKDSVTLKDLINDSIRLGLMLSRGDLENRMELSFIKDMLFAAWLCINKPEQNAYAVK